MRALVPLLLLAGAAAIGSPAGRKVLAPPEPKAVFLKRCSACHDPGRVYHRVAQRDEWREIVERMRRMPQSGISRADANVILKYLVSLGGGGAPRAGGASIGGRAAYGKEWLSVLETATVRKKAVRLGGKDYRVAADGLTVSLRRGKRTYTVALTPEGKVERTALLDQWRVGTVTYELHVILYSVRGRTLRVGRALRRTP